MLLIVLLFSYLIFPIKVIDWDTLWYYNIFEWKQKLRLIWVDTPESNTYRYWYKECYWKKAKQYTQIKIKNWILFFLTNDKKKYWYYWRRLGYLWILSFNGLNLLQIDLLKNWYAKVYKKWSFKYKQLFVKLEKYAKENKIWLWGECKY